MPVHRCVCLNESGNQTVPGVEITFVFCLPRLICPLTYQRLILFHEGETSANVASSRSHSILLLNLESRQEAWMEHLTTDQDGSTGRNVSCADGNEKRSKRGERQMEGEREKEERERERECGSRDNPMFV